MPVRKQLLEHLHALLLGTLNLTPGRDTPGERKNRAKCARIYASRFLLPELQGDALVDAVRLCNEDFASSLRSQMTEEVCNEYAEFVQRWFDRAVDENMVSVENQEAPKLLCSINVRISTS